jgi:hypothetical protein
MLSTTSTADSFYFKCEMCCIIYKPTDEDTLLYEDTKESNLFMANTILLHAAEDPVNPMIKTKCNKCGHDYARQTRTGNDMRLINTCIKCKNNTLYT